MHESALVAFTFFMGTATISLLPQMNFFPSDPVFQLFNQSTLSAFFSLSFTLLSAMLLPLEIQRKFFRAVALLNAAMIMAHFCAAPWLPKTWMYETPWGVLMNGSMSGCFAACCVPLFKNTRRELALKILVALSALLTMRSQPIALLGFVCMAEIFLTMRSSLRWWIVAAIAPLTVIIGVSAKGFDFFHTSGRSYVWAQSWSYFKDFVEPIFGAGMGSFFLIGPTLTKGSFTWAHSEWFQIAFEFGLAGFLVTLYLFFDALYRARDRAWLIASVAGYGMFAIANMPLRYPLSGMLGAYLFRVALQKRRGA